MVKKDTPRIKALKKHSRRHSIKEGIFTSTKTAFADHYISPFAIAINASNSIVALLSSVVGLLGPFTQLFSSRLMEKYSRKKIILKAVLTEALMLIPLMVIALLFYHGIAVKFLPFLLLIIFAIYIIARDAGIPVWFSWMGDIVDKSKRGRWFAKRNLIIGFVTAILVISSSFALDYFSKRGLTMLGFILLFFLAFSSRLTSWKIFQKQYEPKIKLEKGYYFPFTKFVIDSPKNNFGKFAIYRGFFTLACYISAPLLAVYLLRYLEFSYSTYMIIMFTGTLLSLAVLGLWGKFADRYGNYKVLCISSITLAFVPILWILNTSPIYLALVPSLISGIAWAGLHLAEKNFIYDNMSQEKRGLAISYYNMFWGIGTFIGAGLSALLIKFLTINIVTPLVAIFILGSLIRFLITIIGLPKIKEIRHTKKFESKEVLNYIITKQAKPTLIEEMHEITSIKKYLDRK